MSNSKVGNQPAFRRWEYDGRSVTEQEFRRLVEEVDPDEKFIGRCCCGVTPEYIPWQTFELGCEMCGVYARLTDEELKRIHGQVERILVKRWNEGRGD